jgi:TetR/AcrR family acrAB operon transcriptional repressor
MQRTLQDASALRALPFSMSALVAAQGLHGLVVGLINSWLLAPQVFDLEAVADSAIKTYLAGLGLLPGSTPC